MHMQTGPHLTVYICYLIQTNQPLSLFYYLGVRLRSNIIAQFCSFALLFPTNNTLPFPKSLLMHPPPQPCLPLSLHLFTFGRFSNPPASVLSKSSSRLMLLISKPHICYHNPGICPLSHREILTVKQQVLWWISKLLLFESPT